MAFAVLLAGCSKPDAELADKLARAEAAAVRAEAAAKRAESTKSAAPSHAPAPPPFEPADDDSGHPEFDYSEVPPNPDAPPIPES